MVRKPDGGGTRDVDLPHDSTKELQVLQNKLQVLQNKAAKVLLKLPPRNSSTEALLKETTLPSLCYDA